MKERPILWGAAAVCLLLGLILVLLGWLIPGQPPAWEPGSAGGKSVLVDSKKRMDALQAVRPAFPEAAGSESHRVFVSRALVFLPKAEEPVQAMNPEMITEDKIKVGWKLGYGFDPEDPEVASRDDDQDGFTNLEEFQKGTDPRDPQSSPSKWVKLRLSSYRPAQMNLSFAGAAGDRFTLRFSIENRRKDVGVVLGDKLWIGTTGGSPEIWINEENSKARSEGRDQAHLIPLQVLEFKPDVGQRMDPRTQTLIDYNDSAILLERSDGLKEKISLLIDERGKSRGTTWNVGDVTLVSLVPGEGEMGPFRVGQTFAYAGKQFLVRDASATKVSLELVPEGERVDLLPKTP